MLEWLWGRGKTGDTAHILFGEVVDAARQSKFYEDYQVADDLDGRFDMISLHLVLLLDRLDKISSSRRAERLKRYVQEIFFDNLDLSLREMGVGDLSVGKKIKDMAEAFYGRREAYLKALGQGDDTILEETLLRNLYRGTPAANVAGLVCYVKEQQTNLAGQQDQGILAGTINF